LQPKKPGTAEGKTTPENQPKAALLAAPLLPAVTLCPFAQHRSGTVMVCAKYKRNRIYLQGLCLFAK